MAEVEKPRCFVAMAIGQEDTDRVFDQAIKPVISDLGLLPIRVDRVLHNDRIDHRIRLEIQHADVVVADLTYARPSVYWEAGFAERNVPVVYTCRADHLSTRSRRSDESLTVHFDLRNANIITWRGAGSREFRRQLTARLRLVTRPVFLRRKAEQQLAAARRSFAGLSPSERCNEITSATHAVLAHARFTTIQDPPTPRIMRLADRALGTPKLLKKKLGGTTVIAVVYPCLPSLTKAGLEHHESNAVIGSYNTGSAVTWDSLPQSITSFGRGSVKRVRRIKFIPVLGKIPQAKLEDAMPSWRAGRLPGWHYRPDQSRSRHRLDEPALPSSYELMIIADLKSVYEYSARLAALIGEVSASPSENVQKPSPAA